MNDPILHAFLHFYHLDRANASIHMAEVRFSPLTFSLAAELGSWSSEEVEEVHYHQGKYELDKGR